MIVNLEVFNRGRKEHLQIKTNIYYTNILAIGNKSVTNLYIQCFVEIHIYKTIIFCLFIKIACTVIFFLYADIGLDSRIVYRCL